MGGTLLDSLATLTRAYPTERKRLIGPDLHFGRELLLALAQRTGGWIGWEADNLRGIAGDLAFVPLAELGLRLIHDVEVSTLVNRALAECVEDGRVCEQYCDLSLSLGFRRVLRDAILELRNAGVSTASLRIVARPRSPAHDLASVLESYEALLKQERLADPPALFSVALDYFDREADFVLDGVLAVVPTLPTRGLPGQLLERICAHGARVLAIDVPTGLDRPAHFLPLSDDDAKDAGRPSLLSLACATTLPQEASTAFDGSLVTVDVFAAATPANEIREICRRVVSEGLRWDDVEIVATDPDTYGIALDALAQRLDIGVTMLRGLPVTRTRAGRAIFRWFAWLRDGLPADILRQALEAGELHVEEHSVAPTTLARELRALNVGWGRARYLEAIARLARGERLDDVTQHEDESDEEYAERRAARERACSATGALLAALMAVVPEVPERGSDELVHSSCAALARATLGFLDLVPVHGAGEAQAIARIRERLQFLAQVHDEQVAFGSALAALQDTVAEMRAWPMHTHEHKPWSATGGMVHLTDVAHGGTTGRRRVFVVGLDAGRSIGAGRQDPLLHDGLREQLSMQLATVAERRAESTYRLASMLASLRGRVTLSYAVSSMLDDREEGPAPLLLQVWRLVNGDPLATYESFRDALRPPASPVPLLRSDSGESAPCLDARDVWLQAMSDGALLLDATRQLHAAFPDLAHGESVLALIQGEAATPFHGLVPEAGAQLDPTLHAETPFSSSALELIAKCPLSWFYRYGLRLKLPVDSEYDATRWLDSAQRGTLLHEVYERFAREFASRQNELASGEAEARMQALVTERIAEWRLNVPPPGESAFDREKAELESAARAFLQLESERRSHGDEGRWRSFENEFGFKKSPAQYALSDRKSLALRGRVDRVDELPDGSLRVVDYKTGAPAHYGRNPKAGPFNGGRNLQPALYAAAVAQSEGLRVSTFEYLFPTERGSNEIIAYSADELDAARPIVEALVQSVREGRFLPTMDEGDCRFCDCTPICRGVEDRFGRRTVPRVTWARERGIELPEYKTMCALRSRKVEASDE